MVVGGAKPNKGPSLRVRVLGIALFGVFALVGVVVGTLAMKANFSVPKPAKSMQRIDRETTPDAVPDNSVLLEASDHDSIGKVLPEIAILPPAPSSSGYRGRPAIPGLTAISLRVTASRISGPAPLVVHATVLESAWTGPTTGNPSEDLEITWNFGDPTSSRPLTNPIDETTVSTNTDQVGPEAVHVYDTPGSYTITCTARGWNGSAFITATTSTVVQAATVRVQVFNATEGTYTLRVQNKRHTRSARTSAANFLTLGRAAGHAVVPGAAGVAVSGWYRQVSLFGAVNRIATYTAASNGKRSWAVRVTGTGLVQFTVGDAAAGTVVATTVTTYNDTNWHHVAAWCDVATGAVQIVVDGVVGTAGSRTPGLAMRAPADVPIFFGAETSAALGMTGSSSVEVDEWSVTNRPSTSDERAWLYNAGAGRHYEDIAASSPPAGFTTGLLAWWSFDEEAGPTWADSTGNGHTLADFGIAGQRPGVPGAPPKVYRPGGTETAAIAYNASILDIVSAVATTLGISTSNLIDEAQREFRFGGSLSGQAWTLAAGTLAGGFNGQLSILGYVDANTGPGVTVEAWNSARFPDIYFDSNAPSGGTGTALAPYNDAATLRSRFWPRNGPSVRIFLAAGSDFLMSSSAMTTYAIGSTHLRKWGVGADPIIRAVGTGFSISLVNDSSHGVGGIPFRDVIYDRIRFVTDNALGAIINTETTTSIAPRSYGAYVLDCNIQTTYTSYTKFILGSASMGSTGMIGGSISGGGGNEPGGTSTGRDQNLGFDHSSFGCVVGTSISGGGCPSGSTGLVFAHHIYWQPVGSSALARWIRFGPTAPYAAPDANGYTNHEMNFCIKGSVKVSGSEVPRLQRSWNIDSCVLTGTQNGAGFGRQSGTINPLGSAFDRLLITNCRVYKSTIAGNQYAGIYIADATSTTFRNNTFWECEGISFEPSTPSFTSHATITGNQIYTGTRLVQGTNNPAFPEGVDIRAAASLIMTDNTISFQGVNVVNGNRRGAVKLSSWDAITALGTVLIDRNQYYYPNQTNAAVFTDFNPSAASKTLTQWQARGWDLNAVIADPGWVSPQTGNFSTPAPANPTATSYTLTGPTSILTGVAQTYTLTPNGNASGVIVTLGVAGVTGQFTPPTVTFAGTAPVTFQFPASSAGTATLSATNSGTLANPTPLAVTVTKKQSGRPPRITPSQLNRSTIATPPPSTANPNAAKWRRAGRYPF